jgi:hypothetical protein
MHRLNEVLNGEGMKPDLVLPFLLAWYGWLSKEQGTLAKKQNLIIVKKSDSAEDFGGFAHLLNRGKHQLKSRLSGVLNPKDGYAYASYLRAYGYLKMDRYYLYSGTAHGNRSYGYDLYDSCEKKAEDSR